MFVPPLNSKMFPEDIKEFGLRFKSCDVHSRCGHFIASAHSQNVPSNKAHVFIRGEAKKDSRCRFRYDPYKQNRKQNKIAYNLFVANKTNDISSLHSGRHHSNFRPKFSLTSPRFSPRFSSTSPTTPCFPPGLAWFDLLLILLGL